MTAAELLNKAISFFTGSSEGAITAISNLHMHIHKGEAFSINLKAASAGELVVQLKTGTGRTHLKATKIYTSGVLAEFTILEAPTVTDGTTAIAPLNRKRDSDNTSSVLAFSDPADIVGGVEIDSDYIGSDGIPSQGGGDDSSVLEWMLKPSTDYIIKLDDSGTERLQMKLVWYE